VAEFIGTPKISMVPARTDDQRVIPFGFLVPGSLLSQLGSTHDFVIGVRPEAVELVIDGEYAAEVTAVEYLGDHLVVTLDYQGQDLVSLTASERPPDIGRTVNFTVDQKALLYFRMDTGARIGG
jgi:multiple sugar transport system ATP-binding protein